MKHALRTVACLAWALVHSTSFSNGPTKTDTPMSTVGMTNRLEQIVLPGSELEPIPLTDSNQPIVVRLVASFPHGDAFRYDLEYYGLEPGEFNLFDYLRRKDRSPLTDVPPLTVAVQSVLPPGQIEPHPLESSRPQRLGGYVLLLIVAGVGWLAMFAAILFVGRGKTSPIAMRRPRGSSLADRLRPLVEHGCRNELSHGQKAELERLLLAYWCKRLDLGEMKPAAAIRQLRVHDEAGPLVSQLERWLHEPGRGPAVDPAKLLAPYEKIPVDEFCDT